MKKYFKFSQSGFSLVEVMVASGMMIGLGLMLSNLTTNTNKAIKHAEAKNEYELVFNRTYSTINDELNCYDILKSINVDTPISPVTKIPIPTITRCVNPERFMAQVTTTGSNDIRDANYVSDAYTCEIRSGQPGYDATCRHEGRTKCAAGGYSTIYTSGADLANKTFSVDFNFIITKKDASNNSGSGYLELKFKKTAKSLKSSYGGDIARKIDNIFFEFDPTSRKLTRCFSNEGSSINTSVARACTGNNAQLVGDPNDPANPLRCVHEVDKTTRCPTDSYVDGFDIGPDNNLIPVCVPLSTKTRGCAAGEYLVERLVSGNVRISCHSIPDCSGTPGQHLVKGADGLLACSEITLKCPAGNMIVTNPDGTVNCKDCPVGQYLAKDTSGNWNCKSPSLSCNDNRTNAQEYLIGVTSTGDPICRKLITSEAPCQYGAQLTIKGDGSVGTTCCPACSTTETSQVCTGQSFVSSNSCGSICMGSKPIKNGVPGPWYTVSDCSAWNHQKLERRNCVNMECGGDITCSGYEMERYTDCWLYNNQHTFAQCASNGGSVNSQGSFFLCYYGTNLTGGRSGGPGPQAVAPGNVGSCPSGWAGLNNYSSASSAGCWCNRSSADGCSLPDCQTSTASGWWRSNSYNTNNSGYDARRTGFWGCGTNNSNFTCYPSMYERGCY